MPVADAVRTSLTAVNEKVTTFEEELQTHGCLCWTNIGSSMMPLLRAGRDLLIIARKGTERCRRYDTILFVRSHVQGRSPYIVHRVLKVNPDGTYWVVGDNCTSGEIVREEQILGVLTKVVRDGKREIRVTSPWYRLYVHLWCDCYPVRFFLLRGLCMYHRLMHGLKRIVRRNNHD